MVGYIMNTVAYKAGARGYAHHIGGGLLLVRRSDIETYLPFILLPQIDMVRAP
jgi:hypothetical protein